MNTSSTPSTYPRSRLFRNYEAQLVSESKSYPRSRLFQRFEGFEGVEQGFQKDTDGLMAGMRRISVSELFQKGTEATNATNATNATEWYEMDDEMDFSSAALQNWMSI